MSVIDRPRWWRRWIVGGMALALRLATVAALGTATFAVALPLLRMASPAAGTLEASFDRLGVAIFAGVSIGTIAGVLLTHRLFHAVVPLGTRVLHGGILCVPMLALWLSALFDR